MGQKNNNHLIATTRSKKEDKNKKTNDKKRNDKKEKKRLSKRDPESDSEETLSEESEWESETESENDTYEKSSKKQISKKNKKKHEEEDEEEEDEEEPFDRKEYKQFLANMFPSKYSKKSLLKEESFTDAKKKKSAASKSASSKSHSKSKSKSKSKSSKKRKEESESEEDFEEDDDDDEEYDLDDEDDDEEYDDDDEDDDEDDDDDDEDEDDDDEDDEDEDDEESEEEHKKNKSKKINIFLSVSGKDDKDDEYANYFGHNTESDDEDDEDEECNTDDEETFMKEKYEKVSTVEELNTESSDSGNKNNTGNLNNVDDTKTSKQKNAKNNTKNNAKNKSESEEDEQDNSLFDIDVESEYIELLELKKDLTKRLHKNPKSKVLKKRITECCEDIKKLVKDARKNNTKEYKKLIINEKQKPNEMKYFKTKLSNAEQLRVMQELKEVNRFMGIERPYRLAVLESNIPAKLKANAMQKINMLRSMDTCDPEYFKIKNWVDTFMRIPFCKYSSLSVSISDGIDKCHDFMSNAKNVLDDCVYGLDDAKLQILQMIGQWISNPQAMGTAIAIKGPPGTGKTTLVKDGISKIMNREFVFIPLGGTGDASYLEGHSYTYEGSTWGKIVQSLIDSKTMNPVFYFDELDKISDTPKGEEITGILTHLTDSTQNSQFHDKYFSDVDFDLSKCLFIFSYNDESKVNPILKDRMYRIQTKGYDTKEKIVIANKYMLPKIREQVNFKMEDIIIPDETIRYIVSSQHLTQKEDGVRNMKRCLEIIHTKLNLFRLVKPEQNMFSKDIAMNVTFPFSVDTKAVDILIKNEEKQSQSLLSMYI